MVANNGVDKPKATGIKKAKRKLEPKPVISSTGVEVTTIYCRNCMKLKSPINFFQAVDPIDKNGYMSICKDCINDLYNRLFQIECTMERTLLRVCRMVNVAYIPEAVEAAKIHLATMMDKGKESPPFGIYKAKLIATQKTEIGKRNKNELIGMTFVEPGRNVISQGDTLDDSGESVDFKTYLKEFWGDNLSFSQYEFLESELARYKKTHKCDTAAEESLLRQICFAELDIRESRFAERSPDSAIERLQKLMKTASVDPAKTAIAGSGKAQDTFSSFVKTIEENEPADYYKDKKLFKDFDKLEWYFKKYVVRPLKNFVTQSRDFNVSEDDDGDEDYEVFEDESNEQ